MPNASKTHCLRSLSRQRITPSTAGIGPPIYTLGQRLALRRVQLRLCPRRLTVDQTHRTLGVEAKHPIADDLQRDPNDLSRSAALASVLDHRQRQKPPGLIGILGRLRKPAKARAVIVLSKRYW